MRRVTSDREGARRHALISPLFGQAGRGLRVCRVYGLQMIVRCSTLILGACTAICFSGACSLPIGAHTHDLVLVSYTPRAPDPSIVARWKGVVGHTHNLRRGQIPFDQAQRELVAWTRKLNIAALGVGSPWEPESARAYARYEGPERDRYYAGQVDPESVMHRTEIGRLFTDLNRLANGATFFYQDNETPKSRLGHAWWFGYTYDVPAWHDYSQDRPVRYWRDEPEVEINALTGEPHQRRCLLEISAAVRVGAASRFRPRRSPRSPARTSTPSSSRWPTARTSCSSIR